MCFFSHDVLSEKQEKYTDDNYDFVVVGETNDIPICSEHNWSEDETIKIPTCTEKGEKKYTCNVCGETKTEEMAATGKHTYKTTVKKQPLLRMEIYWKSVLSAVELRVTIQSLQ